MGAKSAIKLRKRGVAFKCNLCGRKLMTPDALVAHQRTAHNVNTKRRGRPQGPARKPNEPTKTQVKSDMEEETAAPPVRAQASKTKVEFECPKCFKTFPTYFTALKHIQKYHCVNRQNIPVQPHHANLIQPLRVELCLKCMCKFRTITAHVCTNTDDAAKLFVCAACEKWFPSLKVFDSHVVSMHGDHVESMFFPTSLEFTKWKTEMEQQMNVNYGSLEQYDSKWHYHCNYVRDGRDKGTTNYICPSTIVVQEFTKGVQVHFYHQHHNHCSSEYQLSHKYKKYSISSFMKRTEDYNNLAHLKQDDNDLYMQFKALMEGIIVDAAKINVTTLKVIVGKALEITAILTNYDEELDDISTVALKPKQVISDVEITKLLEQPLTKRKAIEAPATISGNMLDGSLTKRKKIETPTFTTGIPDEKQIQIERDENVDSSSPKIVNSFSLAEGLVSCKPKTVMEQNKKVPEVVTEEEKTSKVNGDDTPSSFNDSYKDFVVKNFPSMESVASRTRSKPVVKTRIGQFKPNLTKINDKSQLPPLPIKIVEDKAKSVLNSTKIMDDKPQVVPRMAKIVDDQPKVVPKMAKTVEDSPKLVPRMAKTGEDSPKLIPRMSKTMEDSPKLVPRMSKTVVDSPKLVPRTAKVAEVSPKLVPRMAKNVEDKTNASKLNIKTDKKTQTQITIRQQTETENKVTPKTKFGKTQPTKKSDTPKAKTITRNYSVSSRASFDKPKVDFEYEVKEQADDCNILILKM